MRLSAFTRQTFAPTPLALDRFEPYACFRVLTRRAAAGSGESSACRDAGPFRPAARPRRRSRAAARCARCSTGSSATRSPPCGCKLGSGRTITVRDARRCRRRSGGATSPRGCRAGRRCAAPPPSAPEGAQEIGMPPGGLPCPPDSGISRCRAVPTSSTARRLPAGPGQQVAAEDGGHRLARPRRRRASGCARASTGCSADASDCFLPAVDPSGALVFDRDGCVSRGAARRRRARAPARRPRGPDVARRRLHGPLRRPASRSCSPSVPRGHGRAAAVLQRGGRAPRARVRPARGPAEAGPSPRGGPGWRLVAARYGNQWCVGLGASPDDVPASPSPASSSAYVNRGLQPAPGRAVRDARPPVARPVRACCAAGGACARGSSGAAARSAAAACSCSPSRAAREVERLLHRRRAAPLPGAAGRRASAATCSAGRSSPGRFRACGSRERARWSPAGRAASAPPPRGGWPTAGRAW